MAWLLSTSPVYDWWIRAGRLQGDGTVTSVLPIVASLLSVNGSQSPGRQMGAPLHGPGPEPGSPSTMPGLTWVTPWNQGGESGRLVPTMKSWHTLISQLGYCG